MLALGILDLMRQRELERLHRRIDRLGPPAPLQPRTEAAPVSAPAVPFEPQASVDVLPGAHIADNVPAPPAAPEMHPLIAATLAARTDQQLSNLGGTTE